MINEDRFQLATYKKMPIAAERGEGVWLYAGDGDKYLRIVERFRAACPDIVPL